MAEKTSKQSAIAIFTLVAVIIGVIITAVVTNKQQAEPVSKPESNPSFSMGLGQEYDYPKGDKKSIKIKTADKNIVSADKNGRLTAVAIGTTTVTIRGQRYDVTVCNAPSALELSAQNLSLGAGEAVELKASVPDIENLVGIEYDVSDEAVVSVENGTITALATGRATITAKTYNGIKAVCQVAVANAPEEIFYSDTLELNVGSSKELRPGLPEGCAAYKVKYESSNTEVVKIEENGKASAIAEGEADITATVYNGVSATCHVFVKTLPYYIRPNLDPDKPMIALSFDDGPYKPTTTVVLDTLKEYNASATFFIVGNRLKSEGSAECAKQMVEMGCQLGNHTYNHEHYGKDVTAQDIEGCIDIIEQVTGKKPTALRPTGGSLSDVIRQNAQAPVYIWSLDTLDWKYRDANRIYNVLVNDTRDGDIVLMHDIYESTAKAVYHAVPALTQKGYQIVNIAELAYYKGINTENGEVYYSFR